MRSDDDDVDPFIALIADTGPAQARRALSTPRSRATPGRAALVALERARRWRLLLAAVAGSFFVGVVAASVGTAAVAVAALAGAGAVLSRAVMNRRRGQRR